MSKSRMRFEQNGFKYKPLNQNRKESGSNSSSLKFGTILNFWLAIMTQRLHCEQVYSKLKKLNIKNELFFQLKECNHRYLNSYDFPKLMIIENKFKNKTSSSSWSNWFDALQYETGFLQSSFTKIALNEKLNDGFNFNQEKEKMFYRYREWGKLNKNNFGQDAER
jgi:hypothetical protein